MKRSRQALALLSVTLLCAVATAQDCDSSLRATDDRWGYRPRDSRCEGMYQASVSSEAGHIELLSLLCDGLRFELAPGKRLIVSACTAAADAPSSIRVRSVALPLRTYYQMDAEVSPDSPLVWPVDDVLLPYHLDAGRLGVYGWFEDGPDRVYVPLHVDEEGGPDTAHAGVQLRVRCLSDLETLVWRLQGAGEDGTASDGNPWHEAAVNVHRGETVEITLPRTEGLATVEFYGKVPHRNKWVSLVFNALLAGS